MEKINLVVNDKLNIILKIILFLRNFFVSIYVFGSGSIQIGLFIIYFFNYGFNNIWNSY